MSLRQRNEYCEIESEKRSDLSREEEIRDNYLFVRMVVV